MNEYEMNAFTKSIYDNCTKIMKEAARVRENSYSPYSGFKVGAALMCKGGKIYSGCNYENASFGAGICAERAALSAAISAGEREVLAIAIACGDEPSVPCGICLQALSEFGRNMMVICADKNGENEKVYWLSELMPFQFSSFKGEK